jgi:cell division protein FtsQ
VKTPSRRRPWKRLAASAARGVLLLGLSLYAVVRGASLVTAAPALEIRSIAVHGARQLETADVLNRVGGLRGQNIVLADLDRARAKLLEWAWVRDASFRRVLPSTVEIAIVEREPIGLGRIGERLFLVAADGTMLGSHSPRHAEADLPLIDGLHVGPSPRGLFVDDERAGLAAKVIAAVRRAPDLSGRLSQVDVSDAEDAVVLLEDDSARVHLGQEQFAERLRSYLELAPALRARVAAIDSVDLRYEARVFVRPRR